MRIDLVPGPCHYRPQAHPLIALYPLLPDYLLLVSPSTFALPFTLGRTKLISGLLQCKQAPATKEAALETEWKLACKLSSAEASQPLILLPKISSAGQPFQWDWADLGNKAGSFHSCEWTSECELKVPFIVSSDFTGNPSSPAPKKVHLCKSLFSSPFIYFWITSFPVLNTVCATVRACHTMLSALLSWGALCDLQNNYGPDAEPAWICLGSLAEVQHCWNLTTLLASQDHPGFESSSITSAHYWEATLY